jgi:hypothetical protein
MREAKTAIRTAFFNALNGQITDGADAVGVFDGKVEDVVGLSGNKWIILGPQSSTDRSNKHQWASEESIEVLTVEKAPEDAGRKTAEVIMDEVLQIIMPPAPGGSYGVTIGAPFSLVFIRVDASQGRRPEQMANREFNNIQATTFVLRVTQ